MQQFMAPASSLAVPASNDSSIDDKHSVRGSTPHEAQATRPVIFNKALQLPPSPPSSVSSTTGNKLHQPPSGLQSPITTTPPSHSTGLSSTDKATSTPLKPESSAAASVAPSPSFRTPFDFVSPFDILSKPQDDLTPQPAPAPEQPTPSSSTDAQPSASSNGYEAANAGIASLLQKLSASSAANKSTQQKHLPVKPTNPSADAVSPTPSTKVESTAQAQAPSHDKPVASSAKDSPTRATFRQLPSLPGSLDAPEKQFHASRHAAVLKQDDAFDDPKSSGLSVLSPSRSSSAPSIATLDLSAKQPGGLSSLRRTKVETSGVALLPSPFHFPCNVSAAGLLPASRVANLGHSVACYTMSKGKVRLIHVGTGARLLVQAPNKAAIRSIAAFESYENKDAFLLAALVERSKDASDEGVVVWSIPSPFVQQGNQTLEPVLLGRVTADPHKSPFAHRFTSIAWHPLEPKLAISTSDSNVLVVDVAQELLRPHGEVSSSLKEMRSLSESDIDPQSKAVVHNEPLAGFAFTPDGSKLATVSAPLEGDKVWTLRFKSLDGSTIDKTSFAIESPLQESMVMSHISFIHGVSKGSSDRPNSDDSLTIRGVLFGFKCNTVLGLYDLSSRSFKHVWKFQGPPQASAADKEHFNLVHLDVENGVLLVCNSFRSSIFAVPLEFQPHPARPEDGLLPWTVQLSYPIEEYALLDPCTSVTISPGPKEKPARLFVAFPEGISVVQLVKPESLAQEAGGHAAKQVIKDDSPCSLDRAETVSAPAHESSPEAPAVEQQATTSKSSKKKNKKKKTSTAKTQADEAAASQPDDAEELPAKSSEPSAREVALNQQQSQLDAQTSTPQQTLSVAVASDTPSASDSAPIAVQQPSTNQITISAESINAALTETITSAVHDAISANISSNFQHSIENALPQQVERLITSTELKAELTRNIAQTILPAVQRTAMEVVSRVLAPHFEDVMMQVTDRVERAIVSEITNVRKTLIAEQTESFNETDKVVKAIQSQVGTVLEQLERLRTQPANKITVLKDDTAPRAMTTPNPARKMVSADELSEVEAAPAAKTRNVPASVPVPEPIAGNKSNCGSAARKDDALAAAQLPTKCVLPERVAVIGAGPVGCLAALAFAQRGCKVDIFESRPDPRTHEAVARASQRSINLALSTRGITGLRSVSLVGLGKYASTGMDLADLVLQDSVPMRARMIHVVTKQASAQKEAEVKEISQLYSTKGESINSVDRGRLNNILLDHALMHPNIEVHFEHKLQSVDFDHDTRSAAKRAQTPPANGVAAKKSIRGANATGGDSSADELSRRGKSRQASTKRQGSQQPVSTSAGTSAADRVRLDFDVHSTNQRIPKTSNTHYASFVVGCDGAHSSIRSAMGSLIRMHYTHNYIDTGYVELSIPARTSLSSGSRTRGSGGADGKPGGHDAFHLDPNHLHIWPRHSFMLIALPNLDGSFTCTLFAPFKMFASELSTKEGILAQFREHFPDALPLIGEAKLVECLTTRRASALGSVQCDPYHYKDRAVLIGDAAHAMLPFYGQGLNCGFEDVRVMFDIIDGHETLEAALDKYTKERHPDLKAILQLAEQNYREMAHSVVSWPYLLRKKLDGLLMSILPSSMWSSLYAMTTFSNLPYSTVVRTEKRQQAIISHAVLTTVVGLVTGAAVGVYRTRGVWQPVTKGWIETLQKKS